MRVRLHLTNIRGTGARHLVTSLLPAFFTHQDSVEKMYLDADSHIGEGLRHECGVEYYRRRLPNALSRFFECTVFGFRFDGASPLIVLGDLPLATRSRQIVFVQTAHLVGADTGSPLAAAKYAVVRAVFRLNIARASRLVVQTDAMRHALESAYPSAAGKVIVVGQPPPQWLLDSRLRRYGRQATGRLRLLYPAACYPHKNHQLLAGVDEGATGDGTWPVDTLTLTIEEARNPKPGAPWLACAGEQGPADMLRLYKETDGLLFLSRAESYGLPLVEAMHIGIPIVCPDLPYARALCGDEAIYFDPRSASSLQDAVVRLQQKLSSGWWPDWSAQLKPLPRDWNDVAQALIRIALSS